MSYLEILTLGLYDWLGFLVVMTLIWAFFSLWR